MNNQELIRKAELVIEKTPPNALKYHWKNSLARIKAGENSERDINILKTSLRFL